MNKTEKLGETESGVPTGASHSVFPDSKPKGDVKMKDFEEENNKWVKLSDVIKELTNHRKCSTPINPVCYKKILISLQEVM